MNRSAVSLGVAAACLCALLFTLPCIAGSDEKQPAIPTEHETQLIEGWQVHVDKRLLSGDGEELGKRAIRMLANQLFDIKLLLRSDRVKALQDVHIWLDRTHGKLKAMQYHPSAGWLKDNGFSEALAKCVHIPDAADFANARLRHHQPFVVLHELAHAYHNRVLDFDEPEIKAAYQRFKESGKYKATLLITGKMVKHYALTDHKEFFAEMSESYFGMNDFFPFNAAELQREEPEIFELLKKIWGPLP